MLPVGVDHEHGARLEPVDAGADGRALAASLRLPDELRAGLGCERVELLGRRARAVVDEDDRADLGEDRAIEGSLGNVVVGGTQPRRVRLAEPSVRETGPAAPAIDAIATSRALAAPRAVPATVSSGKCAPNSTRVNATAATYAESKTRNRGNAIATDTRGPRDRHVAARERVQVCPAVAVEDLMLEHFFGARPV